MIDRVVRIVTDNDSERQDLFRVLEQTKATVEIVWVSDLANSVDHDDDVPPMWLDLTPREGMTPEVLAVACQNYNLNAVVAPKQ